MEISKFAFIKTILVRAKVKQLYARFCATNRRTIVRQQRADVETETAN
jgi:hypothetical protein